MFWKKKASAGKGPAAFSGLIDALNSAVKEERHRAATELLKKKADLVQVGATPTIIPILVEIVVGASRSKDRMAAARAIEELGDTTATPGLLAALGDDREEVRGEVVRLLGELNDPKAVPELVRAVKDPSSDVRLEAVRALTRIADYRGLDAVIGEVRDVRSVIPDDKSPSEFPEALMNLERMGWPLDKDLTWGAEFDINRPVEPGDLFRAIVLAELRGRRHQVALIYEQAGLPGRAFPVYEEIFQYEKAAEQAERAGKKSEAASLYEMAGLPDKAFPVYESLGDFMKAAHLAERVGRRDEAGRLFEAAARSLEATQSDNTAIDDAGEAYLRAAENFYAVGDAKRGDFGRSLAAKHRLEPRMLLSAEAPGGLRIKEWDAVNVTVANQGYGPAQKVGVRTVGPLEQSGDNTIKSINPSESESLSLDVRPQDAGTRVPVEFEVSFEDHKGRKFTVMKRATLLVSGENQDKAPQSIQIE